MNSIISLFQSLGEGPEITNARFGREKKCSEAHLSPVKMFLSFYIQLFEAGGR